MHECNPPFTLRIDILMAKITSSLAKTEEPLGFILILPADMSSRVMQGLQKVNSGEEPECLVLSIAGQPTTFRARYLRGTLILPKNKHAYYRGNQEVAATGKECWLCPKETACWWLQNDAASKEWPCSAECLQEVRDSWIIGHAASPRE